MKFQGEMENFILHTRHAAMLNYACEAGEAGKAGDGNTAAFTTGAAAKMTIAVR